MSVENAKLFLKAVSEDKALEAKFTDNPQDNEAAAVKYGLQIAAEAGFSFTEAEFKEAASSDGDLSDDDLEGVSGGFVNTVPYDPTQTPGNPGFRL